MRVRVLRGQCAGHALCNATAPQLFGLDEEGQAMPLIVSDVPAEMENDARAAAGTCPERALVIEP